MLNCVRQLVVAQSFDKSLVPGHVAELCSAYLPSDACEVPVSDPERYQSAKTEGVGAESGRRHTRSECVEEHRPRFFGFANEAHVA